jgi:hypothetical protein
MTAMEFAHGKSLSRLKSLYHGLLPPNLRGRLGLGLRLSHWLCRNDYALITSLLCHSPFSAGDVRLRAALTLKAAGSCYESLLQFLETSDPGFSQNHRGQLQATHSHEEELLKQLLDHHGSDKASKHRYHQLYARVLSDPTTISALLEFGIGTNNPQVVSNMSENGIPGASLRVWRAFLPSSNIHGVDIDAQILFSEERIECHLGDQLSRNSLEELRNRFDDQLDILIDDGLHSIQANLNTLEMGLKLIRPMGWIFIEDIYPPQADFFLIMSWILMQQGIASRLYAFDAPGMIFATSPGRPLESFPA